MGVRVKDDGQFKEIYVKALDSMPVGTIVEYIGQASDIPTGWETYGTNQIKKTSETRPLASHTVNAYSESESNAYSCDYSNKAFGGKILWTNPNPANSFSAQDISLSSSNFDEVEIVYALLTTGSYDYRKSTGRIPYQQGKKIQAELIDYDGNKGLMVYRRLITMTSKSQFNISNCDYLYTIGNGTENTRTIPLYIIGYNTGLFPTQQSTRSLNTYSGDIEEKKDIVIDDGNK